MSELGRLGEISRAWNSPLLPREMRDAVQEHAQADIAWLIEEIRRLRTELAGSRPTASKPSDDLLKEAATEIEWLLTQVGPGSYSATSTLTHLRAAIAAAELAGSRPTAPQIIVRDPSDEEGPAGLCHAGKDGECNWSECPQLRDDEPARSHRHCPLDYISVLGRPTVPEPSDGLRKALESISQCGMGGCSGCVNLALEALRTAASGGSPQPPAGDPSRELENAAEFASGLMHTWGGNPDSVEELACEKYSEACKHIAAWLRARAKELRGSSPQEPGKPQ